MSRKVQIFDNWYSQVDSPTYKLTLFLVHPDIWNEPMKLMTFGTSNSDVRQNGLAVVIAESGVTTEYSIDNLTMMSFVSPTPGAGSTQSGVIQFNLNEPLGFKLLNRVLKYSGAYGFKTLQSAKYVLKVEFLGRDPVTTRSVKYGGEFFYSIIFKQIQGSVSEMGTRYNIIAHNSPKTAASISKINIPVKIPKVKTVNDLLKGLEKACNDAEIEYRKDENNSFPTSKHKWKFVLDDSTKFTVTERIKIPQNDDGSGHTSFSEKFDLGSKPIAGIANSGSAGGNNRNPTDASSLDEHIKSETNIVSWLQKYLTRNVSAIGQLNKKERTDGIKRSYIQVTPEVSYGSATDEYTNTSERTITIRVSIGNTFAVPHPDPKTQEEKQNNRENQKKWFAEMPIVKRYDYLYSGLNTEILSFDLNVENAFYMARDPSAGLNYGEAKESKVPTNPEPPKTSTRYAQGNTSGFATFLSEMPATNMELMERIGMQFAATAAKDQQANESKGKDLSNWDALADLEFKNRSTDFLEVNIKIKGDPFWMGTPGVKRTESVIAADDFLKTDSLILFMNYMPTQVQDGSFEYQGKGELDVAASGVYEVRQIEIEMSQGEFTQSLKCFRNRNISTMLVANEMEGRRS